MVVFVSGGPLNANPVAEPDSVCRGTSSQLYANPGGGSGAYSYDWTCIPPGDPPWTSSLANPVVAPDTTTQYLLTVFDGFNTAGGSRHSNGHACSRRTRYPAERYGTLFRYLLRKSMVQGRNCDPRGRGSILYRTGQWHLLRCCNCQRLRFRTHPT
ncbi:MAG: hypothetical protein MZV63_56235 [Marinilabiliales bacterium]|nr:hypothetical protein [Marinilabiliales bacterium]